jgi:predicted dehydrogenase
VSYSTIIIGLGQIGMNYDYDLNQENYILTHAQTINTNPTFDLVGGIDVSEKNRKRFEEKFDKPSFAEVIDVKSITDLDLAIIAVSTKSHIYTVKKVISFLSPKMILIEKPLSFLFKEAQDIISTCKDKNIPIAVNYIREYEPSHRKLFDKINNDELGFPLKTVCWYSKGIINNGSHFIQLLSNFMGEVNDIKIINNGRKWNNIDPEPTLEIIYEKGRSYFIPVEEENYSLFEMEIVGPKGKIKYYNGGSHYDWWSVSDDPVFKDYKKLESEPITTMTDFNKYQYHVYKNIIEYFQGNCDLYCDGKTALRTAQILDQIQQKTD